MRSASADADATTRLGSSSPPLALGTLNVGHRDRRSAAVSRSAADSHALVAHRSEDAAPREERRRRIELGNGAMVHDEDLRRQRGPRIGDARDRCR